MRRSDFAKECGNCPRGFFRLFNEQHMRRAWQYGEMRRRDGVRYSPNNWWRRRFVAFTRNTDRGNINLGKPRERVDVPHGVPSSRPAVRIVREKSFTCSFVLACREECVREPTIQGRLEYVSHAVAARIVTALPGDGTALRCLRCSTGADRERADGLRIFERKHHCHHAAEREASDCRGCKVNFAQEHMQLVGIVLERAHRHTHAALAMATLVEREHGELLTQDAGYGGKKRQIKSDWVQQYHVWPDSIDLVFERAHDVLFLRVVPSVSQTCEVPR